MMEIELMVKDGLTRTLNHLQAQDKEQEIQLQDRQKPEEERDKQVPMLPTIHL